MPTKTTHKNIPTGWSFHKLNDLLTFVVDNRGKTPPTESAGIPMAEVNAVGDKRIKYSEITKFVSEETYKNWFRKHLEKNDILFSTVGRTASCSLYTANIKTVIAQNLIGLRFGEDNPEFMFYLLTQDKNNQKFKDIEMSAAQPSVKVSQMIHLKFLVPPLPEQNRIVAVLEAWDRAIESLTKKIDIKKQVKKGLMQKLLTGKTRLKGFSGKWETVELGDVCIITMGQSPLSSAYNERQEGIPLIQGNNDIKERKTISRIWTSEITKIAEENDIIMTVRAPVGCIGVATERVCIGRGVCSIRGTKINPSYILKFLESYENKWKSLEQGSTFTAVNSGDIRSLSINVPKDKDEQNSIANILAIADNEITTLEKKLTLLKDQKKYLLNTLITGDIRTPENLTLYS